MIKLKDKYEIIIVNDGSTDKTKEIINSFNKKKNHKILSLKKNIGFGKAFVYGLNKAKGDRIVMIQGDNAWNSKNLKKLFQAYNDKSIDLLIQYNSKIYFFSFVVGKGCIRNSYYSSHNSDQVTISVDSEHKRPSALVA